MLPKKVKKATKKTAKAKPKRVAKCKSAKEKNGAKKFTMRG